MSNYPRHRSPASGHVRFNPLLEATELTTQPQNESRPLGVLGPRLELGDPLLDCMPTPHFRALFRVQAITCLAAEIVPEPPPCTAGSAPRHRNLVAKVNAVASAFRTQHPAHMRCVASSTPATLEANPTAATHVLSQYGELSTSPMATNPSESAIRTARKKHAMSISHPRDFKPCAGKASTPLRQMWRSCLVRNCGHARRRMEAESRLVQFFGAPCKCLSEQAGRLLAGRSDPIASELTSTRPASVSTATSVRC